MGWGDQARHACSDHSAGRPPAAGGAAQHPRACAPAQASHLPQPSGHPPTQISTRLGRVTHPLCPARVWVTQPPAAAHLAVGVVHLHYAAVRIVMRRQRGAHQVRQPVPGAPGGGVGEGAGGVGGRGGQVRMRWAAAAAAWRGRASRAPAKRRRAGCGVEGGRHAFCASASCRHFGIRSGAIFGHTRACRAQLIASTPSRCAGRPRRAARACTRARALTPRRRAGC